MKKLLIGLVSLASISCFAETACKVHVTRNLFSAHPLAGNVKLNEEIDEYKKQIQKSGHIYVSDIQSADYIIDMIKETVEGTGLLNQGTTQLSKYVLKHNFGNILKAEVADKLYWTKKQSASQWKNSTLYSIEALIKAKARFAKNAMKNIKC